MLAALTVGGYYHAWATPKFRVTDLGTLGGANSIAYSINNSGAIVGSSTDGSNLTKPFIFQDGSMSELPTSGQIGIARCINDAGDICGQVGGFLFTTATPVVWLSGGAPIQLGNILDPDSGLAFYNGVARSINNLNFVTGEYSDGVHQYSFTQEVGYAGVRTSVPSGATSDGGEAVSNSLSVIGTYTNGSSTRGFLKPYGLAPISLPTLGGTISRFHGANNTYAVGEATILGNVARFAVRWSSSGGIESLGTLGSSLSIANAIAPNLNLIVGMSNDSSGLSQAIAYDDTNGFYDLNSVREDSDPNIRLVEARAVNDNYNIVGNGIFNGAAHAFLAQPAQTVHGHIFLGDWNATPAGIPIVFIFRNPTTHEAYSVESALLDSAGDYTMTTIVQNKAVEIVAKAPHWLAAKSIQVDLAVGTFSTTVADFDLLNGDCDDNNIINTDDYLILSDSFDTSEGDDGFDPRADLDGNGLINTDDYLILSTNFDLNGE